MIFLRRLLKVFAILLRLFPFIILLSFLVVFHGYRIPEPKRLSLTSDSLCRGGNILCPIVADCPLRRNQQSYEIPDFVKQLSHNCDGHYSLDAIELWKFNSFREEYSHEFLVLEMSKDGTRYVVHVHRAWRDAWAGPGRDGLPFMQGSRKVPRDHISVHHYNSSADREEKAAARRVARFSLRWFPSPFISPILQATHETGGPYNIIGMNCWGWSRLLMFTLLRDRQQYIHEAFSSDEGATIAVNDAWEKFNSNFWLNWALLLRLQRPTHPLIRRLVQHGQAAKRLFSFFSQPVSLHFSQQLPLEIGVNGITNITGQALTDAPHYFAVNDDTSSSSSSLSVQDVLYFLSPPLTGKLSSIQLTVYTSTPKPANPSKSCRNSPAAHRSSLERNNVHCLDACMWVETAIMRRTADGSLSPAKERFSLGSGDSVHSLLLDMKHPMLQRLRDGDMIALWIRVGHGSPLVRGAEMVVRFRD